MKTQLIQSLSVQYGSEAIQVPPNAIPEYRGGNNDINAGYGGQYVWLTPNFTENPHDAVTSFQIFIVKDAVSRHEDLAKGAGGDFRYQIVQKNPQDEHKVSFVQLLRSNDAVEGPPEGFSGMSSDINQGRGKTYLYLIWKATRV